MKKHILGIALFASILGISAITYSIFIADGDFSDLLILNSENNRRTFQTDQPLVKQAVLDLKTKRIDWELQNRNSTAPVVFHFFVVDKHGAKYLKSEAAPSADEFTSSYQWLEKLKSYENLYVMAEINSVGIRDIGSQPSFDETNATAVLLNSGRY